MFARFYPTRFAIDERGSVAIVFGLTLTLLAAFVGIGVDGSRWYSTRQQHASVIDAALLNGARYLSLNPGDATGAIAAAQSMYATNVASLNALTNSVSFVTTNNNTAVTFTGTAAIKTTFLGIMGIQTLPITTPATAAISTQGSNIEVAVALDVTGSMCDDGTGPCTTGTKISGVKQAATTLVDTLLSRPQSTYYSKIALVPFSAAVRIDEDGTSNPLMQTLTGLPSTWSGYEWQVDCTGGSGYNSGEFWVQTSASSCGQPYPSYASNMQLIPCVTERWFNNGAGFDPGDRAPGANGWLNAVEGDRFPLSVDSSNSPFSSGTGASNANPTWQWNYTPGGGGCPTQSGNEIEPLTDSVATLNSRIDGLTAYGATAGALGTVWTQYMLSPSWSGIWTGNSTPGSYADTKAIQSNGAPKLRKVAILMTDGGYNTVRMNAVDYAWDGGTQMQTVSNYAIQACSNMKSNGIEIYTVGFNLNALPTGEQTIAIATLQACGSDISHFYNSLDVDQLNQAFASIAAKLAPIRLTQ